MLRRGHRAGAPAPEHLAKDGAVDGSSPDISTTQAVAARAEALRADLAGIADRIGELTGATSDTAASPAEMVPSELEVRLDRLDAMAGQSFSSIEELRRNWEGIVAQMTASSVARGQDLGRAVEASSDRFEAMMAELDHRQRQYLAEFTTTGDDRLNDLSQAIDLVQKRLDDLTEMAQPLPGELEQLLHGQGRVGAASAAGAASAVEALDERLRLSGDASTAEILKRLDRLADITAPRLDTIDELRRSWDELLSQASASNLERGQELGRAVEVAAARFGEMLTTSSVGRAEELGRAVETAAARIEEMLASSNIERREELGRGVAIAAARFEESLISSSAERSEELDRAIERAAARFESLMVDRDQRHHHYLAEIASREEGRLSRLSGGFELVSSQLDSLTAMAQPVAAELERLGLLASESAAADERLRQVSEESIEDVLGRLDRLAAATEPGLEMISQLRQSWTEIVERQSGTPNGQGREDVIRAVEAASIRFDEMMADLDQRHHRHLAEFSEQGDSRLKGLYEGLDLVRSRLDRLNDIARPMAGELERLSQEQIRLRADTAGLDHSMRQVSDESAGQILSRLDRLASVTGPGFETIDELRQSLDGIAAQVSALDGLAPALDQRLVEAATELNLKVSGSTRVSLDRADALARTVETALAHFEAVLADRDHRQDKDLADFTEQSRDRLGGLPEALDQVSARLEHLTQVAEIALQVPDALERMRQDQDRLAEQVDAAVTSILETVSDLKQQPPPPGADVLERIGRLGTELEGASDRLRQTAQDIAQDRQDSRSQMATLDLGLRVALTGIESVTAGRQGEQMAQIEDAQREVAESVLQGLNRFGRQIDAGLRQATEELTTSVFLTHEDSDDRSHALQDDLTKALARVEDAELGRDHQLIDLQRVVERLGREVQLLRPAIDLRPGPNQGLLNDVALARFADRVAALLSEEVMERLAANAQPPSPHVVGGHESPPALSPLSSQNGLEGFSPISD